MRHGQKVVFKGEGDQQVSGRRCIQIPSEGGLAKAPACTCAYRLLRNAGQWWGRNCLRVAGNGLCFVRFDAQRGVTPGDIIIVVEEKPHAVFRREGNDLLVDMEISLVEALCGFQRTIRHLDGRVIGVGCPRGEVTAPGIYKYLCVSVKMPSWFPELHWHKAGLIVNIQM